MLYCYEVLFVVFVVVIPLNKFNLLIFANPQNAIFTGT